MAAADMAAAEDMAAADMAAAGRMIHVKRANLPRRLRQRPRRSVTRIDKPEAGRTSTCRACWALARRTASSMTTAATSATCARAG